jgi:hypothetical protein
MLSFCVHVHVDNYVDVDAYKSIRVSIQKYIFVVYMTQLYIDIKYKTCSFVVCDMRHDITENSTHIYTYIQTNNNKKSKTQKHQTKKKETILFQCIRSSAIDNRQSTIDTSNTHVVT